jgi:putative spermidine/putrescine transport system ATP-binding protein
MALSDRIAVMNQGRVEQIGAPFDVYERPSTAFVAGFLGKTNVLPASMLREGSGIYAEIGSGRWPVKQFLADRIVASVRPEKIDFASSGSCCLAGRVRTRIFQGTHWLYQIETAAGTVIVIRQNSGEAVPAEGAAVSLNWRPSDMSIRVASGSHG